MLLTKRIIEVSTLFAGKGDALPIEVPEGIPVVKLETVAEVVLQLTPLSSLLIVLLEPKAKQTS